MIDSRKDFPYQLVKSIHTIISPRKILKPPRNLKPSHRPLQIWLVHPGHSAYMRARAKEAFSRRARSTEEVEQWQKKNTLFENSEKPTKTTILRFSVRFGVNECLFAIQRIGTRAPFEEVFSSSYEFANCLRCGRFCIDSSVRLREGRCDSVSERSGRK